MKVNKVFRVGTIFLGWLGDSKQMITVNLGPNDLYDPDPKDDHIQKSLVKSWSTCTNVCNQPPLSYLVWQMSNPWEKGQPVSKTIDFFPYTQS